MLSPFKYLGVEEYEQAEVFPSIKVIASSQKEVLNEVDPFILQKFRLWSTFHLILIFRKSLLVVLSQW